MELSIGQVIYSKAGRDKRRPFIIMGLENDFVYIADGKLRLVNNPKKKKVKHIQPTNAVNEEIALLIKSKSLIKDSDIRTALAEYWLD